MTSRPRPRITYPRWFSDIFGSLFSCPPAPRHWVAHCDCGGGPGNWGWTAHANTLPAAYHRAIAHLEADHPEETDHA